MLTAASENDWRAAQNRPLILDDCGMDAMTQESKTDLLEVIEGHMEGRSTLIMSQVPVGEMARLSE